MSSNTTTTTTTDAAAGSVSNSTSTNLLLLNQPIVMDNGTSTIKAGFAGSSKPKIVLDTKVGRPKHVRIMPGGALAEGGGDDTTTTTMMMMMKNNNNNNTSRIHPSSYNNKNGIFVGQPLNDHRGLFYLDYPMDHGMIATDINSNSNFDSMIRLWDHVYSKQCLNAKQDDHPVLFTEAPLNHRRNRERIAEQFFESYRCPAMYFAIPSILSLYASGRTTGIVLDIGDGVTHAAPVYEGFVLPHSITRSNIAGRDITQQLQLQLRQSGIYLTTTAEADLTKKIKEDVCYVTPTPSLLYNNNNQLSKHDSITQQQQQSNNNNNKLQQYKLPDGQVVSLSSERYEAPNILFDPTMYGSEEMSVTDVLVQSIMKSDVDLRSKLFTQIVLAGGTTLLPGFGERLLYEVRSRTLSSSSSNHPALPIRISAPPERLHSCFVGGSILASLATFKNMCISRTDYDEHGSNILHRRDI